jgi:hypothetical protein
MQCKYKHNTEASSCNNCCRGKAISITYSECVSAALIIQHAKRMRHIRLSCVEFLVLQYCYKLSHKSHGIKKTLLRMKAVI